MLDFFVDIFQCAMSADDARSLLKSKTSTGYKIFGIIAILALLAICLL